MSSVTVPAARYNALGHKVEDAEIGVLVSMNGETVSLTINGEKRDQFYSLTGDNWAYLKGARRVRAPLPKSYACCQKHTEDAMYEMAGLENVAIRRVTGHSREPGDMTYNCHCGAPADFFIREK